MTEGFFREEIVGGKKQMKYVANDTFNKKFKEKNTMMYSDLTQFEYDSAAKNNLDT